MKKLFLILFLIVTYFMSYSNCCNLGEPHYVQSFLVAPKKVVRKGGNHYFIDFGKDAFGTLSLLFKSAPSNTLVLHLGEKLSDENTVDRNPGGTIRYQKVVLSTVPLDQKFLVELPADQRNTSNAAIKLPDSIGVVMPFRYCEIENLDISISEMIIEQKVFNYRFNDNASSFESSDTILNQVWEMCKHTIKATSFCGVYIDGDRERIPYEADAFINQLSHYCVDNEYTLARKTNAYFINHPTWPTEWLLHTVLLFYNDYLYTGSIEALSEYYDKLKAKTLMGLEGDNGLISTKSPQLTSDFMAKIGFQNTNERLRDIVDWPGSERDGYEMVDVNTVVNSFYYKNLKIMAQIAGSLDKKEDSVFFSNKATSVKNIINTRLFNKLTGLYVDGEGSIHSSLHANMFPLVFGIVPEESINKVVAFVKSRGMACSVYGAQYLLEALYDNDEADYALSLMNSTDGDRNWWNMLKVGSTMALEAWDRKYKSNLDWNHAWGTAPANIISRKLMGIEPLEPGFRKIRIKPQPGTLSRASIKYPTIRGEILLAFENTVEKSLVVDVDIPDSIIAEVWLPKTENPKSYRISVDQKKCDAIEKDGFVVINEIGPGAHQIELEYDNATGFFNDWRRLKHVFPNPVKTGDLLHLNLAESEYGKDALVRLYDINGLLCQEELLKGQTIDIPIHLKPGIYLMSTQIDIDTNLRYKFVVY